MRFNLCEKCGLNYVTQRETLCESCKQTMGLEKAEKKEDKRNTLLKEGDVFYLQKHSDLINTLLNTSYKAWMKCTYPLVDGKEMHFIKMHQVSSYGWTNYLKNNTFVEEYVGKKAEMAKNHMYMYENERVLFEVVENGFGARKYIFRGVFRRVMSQTDMYKRVWEKVSNQYKISR